MSRVVFDRGSGFFPVCMGSGGDDWEYPFALSIQKAMEWFWRIREWELVYEGDFLATPFSITQQSSTPGSVQQQPLKENELPCQAGRGWVWGAGAGVTGSLGIATATFSGGPSIRNQSPTYYPAIGLSIGGVGVTTNPALTGIVVGDLFINGFGPAVLYANALSGGDHVENVTVTLTPVLWYGYADLAGNTPIYDTATGAQLLDPFSFQDPTI